MNTLGLQSIVFILEIIMFVTFESGKLRNLFSNTHPDHWAFVDLSICAPFLLIKYAIEYEGGDANLIRLLRGNQELLKLASQKGIKIKEGYLISPEYLHSTQGWEMSKFNEILVAELEDGKYKANATCYKLCNGEERIINYSSIPITEETQFKTIISFSSE